MDSVCWPPISGVGEICNLWYNPEEQMSEQTTWTRVNRWEWTNIVPRSYHVTAGSWEVWIRNWEWTIEICFSVATNGLSSVKGAQTQCTRLNGKVVSYSCPNLLRHKVPSISRRQKHTTSRVTVVIRKNIQRKSSTYSAKQYQTLIEGKR